MAYYLSPEARMKTLIYRILSNHFDNSKEYDDVLVLLYHNGITAEVSRGYDAVEDKLTEEEIQRGVIGGGYKASLNGKKFFIEVTEDKEDGER